MSLRKVHYVYPHRSGDVPLCGAAVSAKLTYAVERVTCRVCKFRYLAGMAPWAKEFLLDLKAAQPNARTSEGARPAEVNPTSNLESLFERWWAGAFGEAPLSGATWRVAMEAFEAGHKAAAAPHVSAGEKP